MLHKSARFLVGVGMAVLLVQPSTAWAQTVPNLAIVMSHTGNFTLGEPGVYTIVVSNVGGTAVGSGLIDVGVFFPNLSNTTVFGFASATGNGWSCSVGGGIPAPFITVTCDSTSVIAAGASASPISLTVTPFYVSGTVTNTATVAYCPLLCTTVASASDPTIIVAAVPTLPQWAMLVLAALLAWAGVTALRRRTT
jgi:hypothetical protein